MIDQKQQRELRRVWLDKEHALAAEDAARVDAVKPTDELAIGVPCLDAVNDAFGVQLGVDIDKIMRDPRAAALAFPYGRLTTAYHTIKIAIDRERKFIFALFFGKASRYVQV